MLIHIRLASCGTSTNPPVYKLFGIDLKNSCDGYFVRGNLHHLLLMSSLEISPVLCKAIWGGVIFVDGKVDGLWGLSASPKIAAPKRSLKGSLHLVDVQWLYFFGCSNILVSRLWQKLSCTFEQCTFAFWCIFSFWAVEKSAHRVVPSSWQNVQNFLFCRGLPPRRSLSYVTAYEYCSNRCAQVNSFRGAHLCKSVLTQYLESGCCQTFCLELAVWMLGQENPSSNAFVAMCLFMLPLQLNPATIVCMWVMSV